MTAVASLCTKLYLAPEDLVGELYAAETNLVSQVQSSSPRCNIRTGILYWLRKLMI